MLYPTDKGSEQIFEHFRTICRTNGIKLTPQRLLIYEELLNTNEHPSTDMVYQWVRKKIPSISLDTVNRTLLTFCDIGIAKLVAGTGNSKRFDGNLEQHHHFECMKCKKMVDIHHETYDQLPIPQEFQDKFNVLRQIVRLEGLCDTCAQET